MPRSKVTAIGFWIVTALFCLQMSFTAYAQLRLPQVAEAFTHLGFPDYFRVELSLAKLLGVVLLLAPVPARLKEWAYAGFAINLASALIAHLSVGDGPEAWGFAVGTGVLWGLSYFFWRRLQATPAFPSNLSRYPPQNRKTAAGAANNMKKSATTKDESPSRLIDARIKDLNDWRGKTLVKVRRLIKEADPEIVEEWKWVKPAIRGLPSGPITASSALARPTRTKSN